MTEFLSKAISITQSVFLSSFQIVFLPFYIYLRSLDIFGNDVCAADVDHVETAADDQASLVEVLTMPLA